MRISIDKPCSQNLNEMDSSSLGKFCISCQKEVIDFSLWSDSEIKDFFINNPKDVCGSFGKEQLNRIEYSKQGHFFNFKQLGIGLLSGIILFSAPANAEKVSLPFKIISLVSTKNKKIDISNKFTKVIEGRVLSSEGIEPLPGVYVKVEGHELELFTDVEGRFRMEVTSKSDTVNLIFSLVGFETLVRKITFDKKENLNLGDLVLKEDVVVLGEVILAGAVSVKATVFQRIKWKIKKIF